jgi:hypothetical protein
MSRIAERLHALSLSLPPPPRPPRGVVLPPARPTGRAIFWSGSTLLETPEATRRSRSPMTQAFRCRR